MAGSKQVALGSRHSVCRKLASGSTYPTVRLSVANLGQTGDSRFECGPHSATQRANFAACDWQNRGPVGCTRGEAPTGPELSDNGQSLGT